MDHINIINEIERLFPVDKWVILDMHVWPIIRQYLAKELISQSGLPQKNHNHIKTNRKVTLIRYIKNIIRYFFYYFRDFLHNDYNRDEVFALFWIITYHRTFIGKHWVNKFCLPIMEYFNNKRLKSMVFEYSDGKNYKMPRFEKSRLFPYSFIYLFIYFRASKNYLETYKSQLTKYDDFLLYVKKKLNLKNIRSFDEKIRHRICMTKYFADYFNILLKKYKPKIVFQVCYYDIPGWAFNYACRQNGVISVDIQHGIAGANHRSYGNWMKVPDKGYELLPNCFFSWGEDDAEAINSWNKNIKDYHFPIVTGNIWNNQWFDGNNSLVKIYDEKIKEFKKNNHFQIKFYILYTVQSTNIPDVIIKTIEQSPSEWFWGIRVHPTMNRKDKKHIQSILKDSNLNCYNIDFFTDMPLPALFRNIDVHITETSAAVFEAKEFNIHSIVINKEGKDFFLREIDEGWVELAFNENDIIDKINRIIHNKRLQEKEETTLLQNALDKLILKTTTIN